MTTPHQRRFLLSYMGLTLLVIAGLATFDALDLGLVTALSAIVLLVVTALTTPVHVMPAWRRRLRWPLVVAAAVFLVLSGMGIAQKFA